MKDQKEHKKENKCKRCGERYNGLSYWFAPVLGEVTTLNYCSEECRQAGMATYRAKARRES